MTPAERAVIDAARALEKSGGIPAYDALMAAVRALPRPLSEQLAELRVGAVVACGESHTAVRVLALVPDLARFCGRWSVPDFGDDLVGTLPMSSIRRIISNPEADRG